jgi:predicted metal-dependent hydrolase
MVLQRFTDSRGAHEVTAAGRVFPVDIRRHPRARRYVLRVSDEGRLRLTVPRGASISGGVRFARRQHDWIEREWRRLEHRSAAWGAGTPVWYRGEILMLDVHQDVVALGDLRVLGANGADVRASVEHRLREIATREFPDRANVLAAERQLPPVEVRVRNQRSRWGSCSTRGAIALNWRLLQMPPDVADYVILHELAHRRHPDHSRRFWREVETLCPGWRMAERWLRKHGKELL